MRYLIANWKMNLPPAGIAAYMSEVGPAESANVRVVVAPPFPYLKEIAGVKQRSEVAAQNCGDHDKGAYTGEVAPAMIRDCGAQYVILGHSERRHVYGETDSLIARKLGVAIATGLTPVLCIGEDLRTREAGRVAIFLADQVRATAVEALESAAELIIAYEPIWAIGTGRNATGVMCAETVAHIRDAVGRFWPARHAKGPILYGGSVTPENIGDLEANGRVDGYLVGGASLDASKFLGIFRGMSRLT
jgi:triosephosphate isomerase